MSEVVENAGAGRFELIEPGGTAFALYRREDGRLVVPYVEAPPLLRGSGAAGRLMEGGAGHRTQGGAESCSALRLRSGLHPPPS